MFALIWVRQVGGMGYQFGLKKPRCYTYDNAQTDSNKRWEYVEFCTV